MAKKTRLGEEAEIYSKRQEKSEKEKWSELDAAGKRRYFKDYYLVKLLIAVLVISFLGYTAYTMFFRPITETVLYMAVVNDSFLPETEERLTKELGELLHIEPEKQEVYVDATYFGGEENYMSQQKLMTYIYAGTIDVIVTEEEQMKMLAETGMFLDLAELMPTEVYSEMTNSLFMEKAEGDTREKAYGVYLDGSGTYKALGGSVKKPIVGILANTKYKENAAAVIRYLTGL